MSFAYSVEANEPTDIPIHEKWIDHERRTVTSYDDNIIYLDEYFQSYKDATTVGDISIQEEPAESIDDLKLSELLMKTQAYLGLNVTELSNILHVSRQTIYDWRKDNVEGNVGDNRLRTEKLYKFAKDWIDRAAAPLPLSLKKKPILDGSNIVEILSQEGFSDQTIERCSAELLAYYKELASKPTRQSQERSSPEGLAELVKLANS